MCYFLMLWKRRKIPWLMLIFYEVKVSEAVFILYRKLLVLYINELEKAICNIMQVNSEPSTVSQPLLIGRNKDTLAMPESNTIPELVLNMRDDASFRVHITTKVGIVRVNGRTDSENFQSNGPRNYTSPVEDIRPQRSGLMLPIGVTPLCTSNSGTRGTSMLLYHENLHKGNT